MFKPFSLLGGCLLVVFISATDVGLAQSRQIPEVLQPWQEWATWDDQHFNCPPQYDGFDQRICFWPSRLTLSANQNDATFEIGVKVYSETWVPLPGSGEAWPIDVRANDQPIAVIERNGIPSVRLPASQPARPL